jgi:hypothetical protein
MHHLGVSLHSIPITSLYIDSLTFCLVCSLILATEQQVAAILCSLSAQDVTVEIQTSLGQPEWVEKIPVTKMRSVPVRSLDISQSKVSGNLQASLNFLVQGGVGDPTEGLNPDDEWAWDIEDIQPFVVLFWGDLVMAERIMSILERRSIESTPWCHHQFMVFVMGLFHLKMACADALWRVLIEPKQS